MEFAQDCGGGFVSQGFNLIFDTTGCAVSGKTDSDITGEDPDLGAPEPFDIEIVPRAKSGEPGARRGRPLPEDRRAICTQAEDRCDIGAFESP